jgi:PPOX class probable F420-dependent enzyme
MATTQKRPGFHHMADAPGILDAVHWLQRGTDRAGAVQRRRNPNMQIDTTSEFGKRVMKRLDEETTAWLTTIGADGTPQPRPIWFLWDGETILIYSQPNTSKLRHIKANPRVSFNFDGDGHGGNIIVLTGEAKLDGSAPPAHRNREYSTKYARGFRALNMTPESFAEAYSQPIRMTPLKVRGH